MCVQALAIGISYNDFWKMNPRILKLHIDAYHKNQRDLDRNNWLNGQYMMSAIAACFDKKTKYPTEPFLNEYYETLGMSQEELDERELKKMIAAEEQWILNDKARGLAVTED